MLSRRQFVPVLAIAVAAAMPAAAQFAISAKAGLIHYTEGEVLLGGQQVVQKSTEFPEMKEGQELRTAEGRAEVLLTPGVFVRIGENSALKMISNRLSSTRVEVTAGNAIVECAEIDKDQSITIAFQGAEMTFRKPGVYRFDFPQAVIRVYDGEAQVAKGTETLTLKDARFTAVDGVLAAVKFNNKTGDPFFRWAARRAEYIAVANVSAARRMDMNGYRGNGFWYFNSLYGLYTYIPGNGFYNSFFGARFFSPGYAYYVSNPQVGWGSGGGMMSNDTPRYNSSYGYSTVESRGSSTYSGSTAPSAPASAPAASPRTGDSATGRGGDGRGR